MVRMAGSDVASFNSCSSDQVAAAAASPSPFRSSGSVLAEEAALAAFRHSGWRIPASACLLLDCLS